MGHYEIQILIQWLMLFGILSIILLPAIMFRKIALRNNKKGWLFFITGMGVGFISLQAARWVSFLLMELEILSKNESYTHSFILFFGFPAILVTTAVILFRRSMLSNR